MNLIKRCLIFLGVAMMALLLISPGIAQQIPDGVRYKKTSDEINQKAKRLLEDALKVDRVNIEDIFDGPGVCGPLLWDALIDYASKDLREAKPVMLVINAAKPLRKEGRAIVTAEQKKAFWKLFVERIKADNSASVRKAEVNEIQYFWATIPFDIEEPFYVIDFGKAKVLVNFTAKNGDPKIFWMDIVGDLKTLK